MGLETVTHISDLNTAWPVGSTDLKQDGDNHIRNIKLALKTDLPNITGPITLTQAQINDAALKSAANVFTASQSQAVTGQSVFSIQSNNANRAAVYFYTVGSNLRVLVGSPGSAGDVITGDAVGDFSVRVQSGAVNFSLDAGASIAHKFTALNTTTTFNGVAVSDFARQSQSNNFSQTVNSANIQTVTNASAGAVAMAGLNLTNSTNTLFARILSTGFSGTHMAGQAAGEAAMLATTSALQLGLGTNSICRLNIDGSGNFDFKGGTVTRNNASAAEVGTAGAPSVAISASNNTSAVNAGGSVHFSGGSGQTFTLDGDPPADSVVVLVNRSGNNWTIAASGTLTSGGVAGSRTMATGSMASAIHIGSGNWYISGNGLS